VRCHKRARQRNVSAAGSASDMDSFLRNSEILFSEEYGDDLNPGVYSKSILAFLTFLLLHESGL